MMMSENELYEIAQRRINQRNRRWTLWSINLAGLVLSLAALVLLGRTDWVDLAAAVFLAWGGVFAMHTIIAALAESRASSIEDEVAKLRSVMSVYEKPKRLELSEDGELVDFADLEPEDTASSRL